MLLRFNVRLEEAAFILGATQWRTLWRVTLPVILPGIFSGGLHAFIASFVDVPVAIFLSAPGLTTYPVELFHAMEQDFNPSSLASASLAAFFALIVLIVAQRIVGLDSLLRAKSGVDTACRPSICPRPRHSGPDRRRCAPGRERAGNGARTMMSTASRGPGAERRTIIDALARCGVSHVVSVPDVVTSEGLLRPLAEEPGVTLIRVCKEDEGVSICAALSFCGRRALLLMQNTGLLDSINALRAIGVEYRNPVCMMVGLLGKEPEASPRGVGEVRSADRRAAARRDGGCRIACCPPTATWRGSRRASKARYETRSPAVFLLGRPPV